MSNKKVTLSLNASNVTVNANTSHSITIDAEDVEISDLLDHVSLVDAVSHFGEGDVLNEIGIDAVKKHFNLTEPEE